MSATVEGLTQQIGQAITQAIPMPWQAASVEVLFEDDVMTTQGSYLAIHDAKRHSFPIPGSINRLFAQLRGMTRRDGTSMWVKATFTIQSDKVFTVDFKYAD
ncbi:MAG: hypothetical protein WCK70_12980 [Chloroflexales bacterium]